jgi:hypothetical protein
MAVVINEFEVVAEAPAGPAPGAAPANPPAPPPTPLDIEDLLRRQLERCARLRSH